MLILSTSAQITEDELSRYLEYVKGWESLGSYKDKARVLECVRPCGPSLLESYGLPVVYVGGHIHGLRNKGVNEARALHTYLDSISHVADSEMIVKVTGRYHFTDLSFLNEIQTPTYSDVDAVVKKDSHGQVFTGCFACKKGILLHILKSIDLKKMEADMINFEAIIAKGLNDKKVLVLSTIGMVAPIYGTGSRDIVSV